MVNVACPQCARIRRAVNANEWLVESTEFDFRNKFFRRW